MKTVNKLTCLASALAMLVSAAALPASAETASQDIGDVAEVTAQEVSAAIDKLNLEVAALEKAGTITAEDAQMLADNIASIQANNSSSTYESYTKFSKLAISPTTHYLAAVVSPDERITNDNLYFYLNTNILTSDYNNSSRITLGSAFKNYSSFSGFGEKESNGYSKKMGLTFATTLSSADTYSALFTYDLGKLKGNGATSEYEVHAYTSKNPNSPSYEIPTGRDNYTPIKYLYSIGDVNRDGVVDSTDAELILKYTVKIMSGNAIDEAAFVLAGDCDLDGDVDIIDSIIINKYLTGEVDL